MSFSIMALLCGVLTLDDSTRPSGDEVSIIEMGGVTPARTFAWKGSRRCTGHEAFPEIEFYDSSDSVIPRVDICFGCKYFFTTPAALKVLT